MKRRNFLASLAGLFALPFVPKAEAVPKYKVAVDPPCDNENEPDRYSSIIVDRRGIPVGDSITSEGKIVKPVAGGPNQYQTLGEWEKRLALTPAEEQELVTYAKKRIAKLQTEMTQ